MLEIINAPNQILSKKAKPVLKIDKSIIALIEEMKLTLANAVDPIGVGLAAPQIGKSINLFITKPNPKLRSFYVFINPVIIEQVVKDQKKKKSRSKKLEGCLSLTSVWGEVKRANEIMLVYTDENAKTHKKKFKGFMSTIIQHEVDHLHGILFPKIVLEQKGTLYKSEKDENGEDVFEEMKI